MRTRILLLACFSLLSVGLLDCAGGGGSSGGGSGSKGGGSGATGGGSGSSGGGTALSGGGSGATGGGSGSSGGGASSSGGGTSSSGGGTSSSGGGTSSSGGGTSSSGGGSSSTDGGYTCASTIVMNNFNPAEPQNAFWVDDIYLHVESWSPGGGASTDGGYDVLTQELYYNANPVAPFNGTITPNTYVGCNDCFYFSRGCPAGGDPTFDCNQFFLAQSGSYSVSWADFDGGAFTSEGTTLHFVEWDTNADEAVANPTCIDVPKYSVDAGWQ